MESSLSWWLRVIARLGYFTLREALNGFRQDIPDAMDFHLFFVFEDEDGQERQKFVDMVPSDITDEHIEELWDWVCVVWQHREGVY